ncbi:MAG: TonB-dependent receptor [Blastocatellia bacterium]|nr:TonB-dependent receptor [Blastocatellia bacterium]
MRLSRRWGQLPKAVLLLAVLALCLSSPTLAQTDTARLSGVVTDPNGGVLAGANVTVTSLGTSRSITVQTNESGDFAVPALQPGRYRLEVKVEGFKAYAQEVTLETAQLASVTVSLQTGAISDVVEVTSDTPLVETSSSAVGEVIQGRQVTELPLNGRNFTQLATLVPGVSRGVPDGQASGVGGNAETFRNGNTGGAALAVNGLRPQNNNFLLDGVDNNESLVNTIIFFPPAEAIQEFRVQTSVAPAEVGRAGGAIINTSFKSGTNEFHGSAFEFLRNDNLDARPTFAPNKAEFRRNQFGGTLGGPIIKDKLFFFGDYQGLRQFLPVSVDFASVPTPLMRQGNFSELLNTAVSGLPNVIRIIDPITGQPFPGNVIPSNRINPVGQRYLNAFPLPNTNGGRVNGNYVSQRIQNQDFDDFDVRVDYILGSNDTLFGRYSQGSATSLTTSRLPNLPAGFGSGSNFNDPKSFVFGETHTFSPTLINEFRFGFVRTRYGYIPPFQDKQISADLGIPNANTSSLLGGGALIGGFNGQLEYTGDFGPFLVPQNSFQYSDTLTYIRGNHTYKMGASLIRRQVNLFRPNRGKGYFFLFGNGDNPNSTRYEVADVLAGFVNEYTIGPPFGMVGTRSWEAGIFAQDDWKVSRKFTLNYGVRYDLLTWPVEVADRQANFDIATNTLRIAGQNGNSRNLIDNDYNNFAPRIGFAYDIFGDSKWVVRSGYGMFYFLDRGGIDNQLAQNPPFSGFSSFRYDQGFRITLSGRGPNGSKDSRLASGPLPLGLLTNLNPNNPSGVTVFAALPSNRNSYVHQWSLQLQHPLGNNLALSIGYVGTQGKKLTAYYDINRTPTGFRPFGQLGDVNVQETRGNSIYHSLQMQFERRLSNGWQFLTSYTWSHAIDDADGAFDGRRPQDYNRFDLERGNSNIDSRHRFVMSSLYELPLGRGRRFGKDMPKVLDYIVGGFQLNGILTLASGFPFSVQGGNGDFLRADVVGTPQINEGNADNYVAKGNFFRNPGGRVGTSGRNILTGPGTTQLDLSLFKDFGLTERLKLQFRTEFFNIANHPQFSNPNTDVSSGDFGRIRGTRGFSNRQIQFAFRLTF